MDAKRAWLMAPYPKDSATAVISIPFQGSAGWNCRGIQTWGRCPEHGFRLGPLWAKQYYVHSSLNEGRRAVGASLFLCPDRLLPGRKCTGDPTLLLMRMIVMCGGDSGGLDFGFKLEFAGRHCREQCSPSWTDVATVEKSVVCVSWVALVGVSRRFTRCIELPTPHVEKSLVLMALVGVSGRLIRLHWPSYTSRREKLIISLKEGWRAVGAPHFWCADRLLPGKKCTQNCSILVCRLASLR